MQARLIRWFRPSTFVLATLAVLLGAVVLHPMPGPLRFASEALVYLTLALACASWPPLRRVAGQLGWVRLAVFALAFGLATWVQLRKSYGPVYPFVRWTMYSHVGLPPVFVRYDVTTAAGQEMPFPLTEITPSKSPRAFLTRFNHELRAAGRADDGADGETASVGGQEAFENLARLLNEVAVVYNGRNPADPIRTVNARVCTIPVRDYAGRESISCETLLSVFVVQEDRQ